jgi:hypothetical protein
LHGTADAWAAEGTYSAFGVRWALKVDDVTAFGVLVDRMVPGAVAAPAQHVSRSYELSTLPAGAGVEPGSFVLRADGVALAESTDLSEVAEAFERDLEWSVAERSPRRVFLRAGVVGWRDRAIVLPGGPGAGKSTLVRALVGLGATCFSERYAVLDGNHVHAYPARLPMWTEPGMPRAFGVDGSGITREPAPVPVGIVVFAHYRPGALWRPKLLGRGQTLLGLFNQALAIRRDPERVLRVLDAVSRGSRGLEGVRGDAGAVARFLLERLV